MKHGEEKSKKVEGPSAVGNLEKTIGEAYQNRQLTVEVIGKHPVTARFNWAGKLAGRGTGDDTGPIQTLGGYHGSK